MTLPPRLIWGLFGVLAGARNWARYAARRTTLGVRGLVRDEDGRVLLVRHGYVPGWYLPGGGVNFREPLYASMAREMREEVGVEVKAARLVGVYTNFRRAKADHVALYEVTDWRQVERPAPGFEIAEWGFYPPDALPEGTTEATRRRIAEVRGELPLSDVWSQTEPI